MKKAFCKTLILLLPFSILISQQLNRPRLFFSENELQSIKNRISVSGTKVNQLWNEIILTQQANKLLINSNKIELLQDGWQLENMFSLALAYKLSNSTNEVYFNALHDLIFGFTNNGSPVTGLVYISPFAKYIGATLFCDEGRFRQAQTNALSICVDILWSKFSEEERWIILKKIKIGAYYTGTDYDLGTRQWLYFPSTKYQNNHLARQAETLLNAAIVCKGEKDENDEIIYPDALTDIERVRNLIVTNLSGYKNLIERIYDREGSCVEGVEYGMVGLTHSLSIIHNLKKWDNVDYFAFSEIQNRLSKIANWLSYEVVSGPTDSWFFNNINDSDFGYGPNNANSLGLIPLIISGYYQSPLSTWVFDNTVKTISNLQTDYNSGYLRYAKPTYMLLALLKYNEIPTIQPENYLQKSKLFPDRGLVYVRSASPWAASSDIQFSLEGAPCINPYNGTFSVKHDQADKNSFTLNFSNKEFVKDNGRGAGGTGARPEEQNYILIDDKGEAINAFLKDGSWIADWNPRPGKIVSHYYNGSFSVIHGDAKNAFGQLYSIDVNNNPAVISSNNDNFFTSKPSGYSNYAYVNPVENADRYVIYSQKESTVPVYIVMADDIKKDNNQHVFKWRIHSRFFPSVDGERIKLLNGSDELSIWKQAATGVSLQSSLKQYQTGKGSALEKTSEGLLNNAEFNKDVNEIDLISTAAVNPYFHIIMYPNPGGNPNPTVTQISTTDGSCFKLSWPGFDDYSVFKRVTTASSSIFSTDGKLSLIRKNTNTNSVSSYVMYNGSQLTFQGSSLINTYGVNSTVMLSNSKISIESNNLNGFQVFAPNATSIFVNGVQSAFSRNGNYITNGSTSVIPPILSHLGVVGSVSLSWQNFSPNIQCYEIWRHNNQWELIATTTALSYTDTEFSYEFNHHEQYVDYKVRAKNTSNVYSEFSNTINVGGIDNGMQKNSELNSEVIIPNENLLFQNSPNPFNPTTIIKFGLKDPQDVTIRIFNSVGQEIQIFRLGHKFAGYHEISIDANQLSSGLYFYNITAGRFNATKKMMLVK